MLSNQNVTSRSIFAVSGEVKLLGATSTTSGGRSFTRLLTHHERFDHDGKASLPFHFSFSNPSHGTPMASLISLYVFILAIISAPDGSRLEFALLRRKPPDRYEEKHVWQFTFV